MAFQKAIFISLGFGSALALGACGGEKNNGGTGGAAGMIGTGNAPGAGGATGAGGASGGGMAGSGGGATGMCGSDCMHIDYSCYKNMAPVSFKQDLLPMFGLSCVASDCHGAYENVPRASLNLGYKCAYDMNAKWKCVFPTAPDANGDKTKPNPDDPIVDMIYASVMGNAATIPNGSVKRVVPGDPANSFFLLKLADQQNSKGYMCVNTDPSHESNPPPCGVSMPQNQDLYCQGSYRPRFDAIAAWIAQGAMNN